MMKKKSSNLRNNNYISTGSEKSLHPLTKKEGKVNGGGHLELWDNIQNPTDVKKVEAGYNTGVIFKTTDESYHGIPHKLTCPSNVSRNSIAIYYVSEPRKDVTHRFKANFLLPTMEKKMMKDLNS